MRFTTPEQRPPRNYLARREQWRLLMLVMSLGLVVILLVELRKPKTAATLEQIFAPGEQAESTVGPEETGGRPAAGSSAGGSLPPGTFRAQQPAAIGQTAPPETDPPIVPGSSRAVRGGLYPGVDAEKLSALRDNTFFRHAELPAWLEWIELLQRARSEVPPAVEPLEAEYVQLVNQGDFYRGKLVTVRGFVRQVTEQTPAANELGVESYYRVVLQPAGGGEWPIFVYCLEAPAYESEEPLEVTGLFFKNLSYAWQEGWGIAPVLLARRLGSSSIAAGNPDGSSRLPTTDDPWMEAPGQSSPPEIAPFADVLRLAGWDQERLERLANTDLSADSQRADLLDILRRMSLFDRESLELWSDPNTNVADALPHPSDHRGELVRLMGRVGRVTRHPLTPAEADRWETTAYFECEWNLDGGAESVKVFVSQVPQAWLKLEQLDEPASTTAILVGRETRKEQPASAVFVAGQVAWHPLQAREPHVSFSMSVLGGLGMDVGLLDDIRNHAPVRPPEREAFYQMLHAARQAGASQLVRSARRNLSGTREAWSRDLESAEPRRRQLAEEVVRRAGEGVYSVAPLFNDADAQVGELAVFDGVARRVVRIEVAPRPGEGGASDILRRFGIDHYYEMEVFTDDSQNRPIVFCAAELPAGFPTGGDVREPVRVAGFFFKSWRYHPGTGRDAEGVSSDGVPSEEGEAVGAAPASRRLIAPLVIGRSPILLQVEPSQGELFSLIGGGLFVLAVAGVWLAAWWYARGDKEFHARRVAGNYSLPPGVALDDLDLSPVDPGGPSAGE